MLSEQGGLIESGVEPQVQVATRRDFRDHSLLIGFFNWWLFYVPSRIVYIAKKIMAKQYAYFSIDQLLKTLFLPWKRDEVDTSNMALDDKIRVLLMNVVSRLVGATVRFGTILIGLLTLTAIFVAAVIAFICFIISPLVAIGLILSSIFI